MNLVLIGQGAIGLLWYSQLQQQPALNIALKPRTSDSRSRPIYTFTALNGLSRENCLSYAGQQEIKNADVILLCVKSYQVKQVIIDISASLSPDTALILCHNGMGTLDELPKQIVQHNPVLAMLTTQACLRASPLHIIHTGQGQTDLGLVAGRLSDGRRHQILQVFNTALPQVIWQQNIVTSQWLKLAVNCVINPLSAIYDVANGEINSEAFSRSIGKVLQEVVDVAGQQGISLSLDILKNRIKQVAQATARNSSSMRCDMLAGRETEIDYINGYIHRYGQRYNIATPENTRLWREVSQLTATT